MTTPTGLRSESTRTPNASRAGALHSHRQSHSQSRGAIHACNPTRRNSRPVDNGAAATTPDRHAWMALRAIGGGLS